MIGWNVVQNHQNLFSRTTNSQQNRSTIIYKQTFDKTQYKSLIRKDVACTFLSYCFLLFPTLCQLDLGYNDKEVVSTLYGRILMLNANSLIWYFATFLLCQSWLLHFQQNYFFRQHVQQCIFFLFFFSAVWEPLILLPCLR